MNKFENTFDEARNNLPFALLYWTLVPYIIAHFLTVATYSIKDLEKLTGIKAHTIRIWEQRYQLIAPQRTETNIRFYSDEEAKHLLKVAALYKQGMKISHIASLDETSLNKCLLDIELHGTTQHAAIERLTMAMIDLNETLFLKVFNQQVKDLGFKDTMLHIIYPFLQQIGIMWQVGDIHPAQEHFISNLIRQKLIAKIDRLPKINSPSREMIILFLPEGELHELGLLFHSYLLREMNYTVIYLGQSVPAEDLVKVAEKYQCRFFITSIIHPAALETFSESVRLLQLALGADLHFYVAGSQATEAAKNSSTIHKLTNIQDIIRIFT